MAGAISDAKEIQYCLRLGEKRKKTTNQITLIFYFGKGTSAVSEK